MNKSRKGTASRTAQRKELAQSVSDSRQYSRLLQGDAATGPAGVSSKSLSCRKARSLCVPAEASVPTTPLLGQPVELERGSWSHAVDRELNPPGLRGRLEPRTQGGRFECSEAVGWNGPGAVD